MRNIPGSVLVTGGAGFIGSMTTSMLLEAGAHVRVLDSFLFGSDHMPQHDNLDLIQGDVRNTSDVYAAMDGVDAVVHLAGIVGEPACKINDQTSLTTNIISNLNVLECMTSKYSNLCSRLVYVSSCSVYGNVAGMYDQVDERTPPMPLSEYAAAKLEAERMIFDYAARDPRFIPTIVRLTTIFGWSLRPRTDLVTNMFALRGMRGEPIKIFGGGNQFRSLIHVSDVAGAVMAVLGAPLYATDRQIFHIGEETNNVTVKEIAEIVKDVLPDTQIEMVPGQLTDRRDYKIDCTKIKNALNWKAKYSVRDGVVDFVENARKSNLDLTSDRYRNDTYAYK